MSAAESLPAPQTSQIVVSAESVNEEHRLAKAGAENAVQHAIRCGQLLQQKLGIMLVSFFAAGGVLPSVTRFGSLMSRKGLRSAQTNTVLLALNR